MSAEKRTKGAVKKTQLTATQAREEALHLKLDALLEDQASMRKQMNRRFTMMERRFEAIEQDVSAKTEPARPAPPPEPATLDLSLVTERLGDVVTAEALRGAVAGLEKHIEAASRRRDADGVFDSVTAIAANLGDLRLMMEKGFGALTADLQARLADASPAEPAPDRLQEVAADIARLAEACATGAALDQVRGEVDALRRVVEDQAATTAARLPVFDAGKHAQEGAESMTDVKVGFRLLLRDLQAQARSLESLTGTLPRDGDRSDKADMTDVASRLELVAVALSEEIASIAPAARGAQPPANAAAERIAASAASRLVAASAQLSALVTETTSGDRDVREVLGRLEDATAAITPTLTT